jgi:hypothetical protein
LEWIDHEFDELYASSVALIGSTNNRPAAVTVTSVIIGLVGGIWHWLSKPLVGADPCPADGTCLGGVSSFVRGALRLDDVVFGVLAAMAAFLLLVAALYLISRRTERTSSQARPSN